MRGKPAPGSRSPPRIGARRSAAMYGCSERPGERPPTSSCPMRRASWRTIAVTICPGKSGQNKAPWTIRQDHPGGKAPATGTPAMQPNTVNNPYDTDPPVPPELLQAVARALAAALIPPPRRPPPPETETEEPAWAAHRGQRGVVAGQVRVRTRGPSWWASSRASSSASRRSPGR